jgi:hypothetical protein
MYFRAVATFLGLRKNWNQFRVILKLRIVTHWQWVFLKTGNELRTGKSYSTNL